MSKVKEFLLRLWRDVSFIDYRALAAYRIGLGLVLFFDFLTKSFDLTAFYTDRGIYSRKLAIAELGWWSFSFHLASGAFWFQFLLVVVSLVLALALVVGYQTRIIAAALWLFVVSLQGRNHLILHAGDALIRVLLFWSMFLPMDRVWAVDAKVLGKKVKGGLTSIFGFAIFAQLLYMYISTAFLKNGEEWNKTFDAVYYALSLEQFATPLGRYMLHFPGLLRLLTASTYYLELFGPMLLLIPLIQKYVRWALPAAFIGLHFSLFLTMYLGLFPWICMVAWLLFLPAAFWNLVEKILPKALWSVRVDRFLFRFLPEPYIWQSSAWMRQVALITVAACLFGTTVWNARAITAKGFKIPESIRYFMLPLRLDQNWNMFAPRPMRTDGWFVVDGILKDGTSMDTWNGQSPVSFEKPENMFEWYRSTQWRKYLTNLWNTDDPDKDLQLAFGKYVCREWNDLTGKRPNGELLQKYDLYFMEEKTKPPGEMAVIKKSHRWSHDCFGDPDKPARDLPPIIKD